MLMIKCIHLWKRPWEVQKKSSGNLNLRSLERIKENWLKILVEKGNLHKEEVWMDPDSLRENIPVLHVCLGGLQKDIVDEKNFKRVIIHWVQS